MKYQIAVIAILGMTAVILGAGASHRLSYLLSIKASESFDVGIKYQFYHTFYLALLVVFHHLKLIELKFFKASFNLCMAGIIAFSGSIYLLSLNELIQSSALKMLWPVTPIGGILLIGSWFLLIIASIKNK
jgi:uncharacterized membrane protein YgdD (TMEM256/DUF423 family)